MYTAVAYGRKTGVVNKGEAGPWVDGFPGFRARNFSDYYEALAYVDLYRNIPATKLPDNLKDVAKRAAQLRTAVDSVVEAKPGNTDVVGTCPEPDLSVCDFVSFAKNTKGKPSDTAPAPTILVMEPEEKSMEEVPFVSTVPFSPGPLDWEVYSDGSYFPESKRGGDAAGLVLGGHKEVPLYVSGFRKHPAKESMEMEVFAVYKALKRLTKYKPKGLVMVYCDFRMVVDTINDKGVLAKAAADVSFPFWRKIAKFAKRYPLQARWVPGHSGVTLNVVCDKMARLEAGLG